jgi:DedD protein
MEVRVRERLIGALVLVAVVVLLVPSILQGPDPEPQGTPGQPTRRVEVPVALEDPAPQDEVLVPEPELPDAQASGTVKAAPPQAPVATPSGPPEPVPGKSLADARPEPSPAVSRSAPGDAAAWAVQLGAFSNRGKAEDLVAQLRKRGYAAFVLEYRATGQVLYRVRVGPEQDRARAAEIAERLAKDGFQPVVARHP